MYVHFWGTRGSLPVSMTAEAVRGKIRLALLESRKHKIETDRDVEAFLETLPFFVRGTYGGNTSCVEIGGGKETVLCDAGTGLRDFGNAFLKSGRGSGTNNAVFHLFITHVHWDHIQGFPFFVPAYMPGNQVVIYGVHRDLKRSITHQQDPPFFPGTAFIHEGGHPVRHPRGGQGLRDRRTDGPGDPAESPGRLLRVFVRRERP